MPRTLLPVTIAALLAAGTAQAITVVNGGFEDPTGGSIISFPSAGALPGWSIVGGNVETVTSQFWAPSEVLRSLDLNGTLPGTIRQTIGGFQISATYELLFDMGGNFYSNSVTKTATASIGSASQVFSYDPVLGDTVSNFTWKEMSLVFEATGTSQTLTFAQGSGAAAAGAALDNIRINLIAPVPVPASLPLLLAGFGAFAWMRRKAS
jgi:choice-of-anchor C domain-containing protein